MSDYHLILSHLACFFIGAALAWYATHKTLIGTIEAKTLEFESMLKAHVVDVAEEIKKDL